MGKGGGVSVENLDLISKSLVPGLICVFINSSRLESLKTVCPFYVP